MTRIRWIVETDNGTVTHDVVLTDAQMTKFTDWVWVMRPQRLPNGTPAPKTVANVTTAVEQWAAGEAQALKDAVRNAEGEIAARAAIAAAVGLG